MIGELMIRFDKKVPIFEDGNIVKIPIKIGDSEELNLLKTNKIPLDDNILRIMVLGDSYIKGGGIDFNKNFSHVLKSFLVKSNSLHYKNIYILDMSRASNNNLDNYNTYFEYINKFKPQLVILGYNINAVNGNLDKVDTLSVSTPPLKSSEKLSNKNTLYDLLYQSELIHLTLRNLHKYLKSYGIIFPNSVFDQVLKSYTQNKSNWLKSKELLSQLIVHADKNNIKIITLLCPYIDMLKYPKLFTGTESIIENYFNSFPNLIFINLREAYIGKNPDDFILSVYDGHPNEKGHLLMAKTVYPIIERNFKNN